MEVALFIPCYIDQFYPKVGIASLRLLERLGCKVHYPSQQTCCGQPLANSGMEAEALGIYTHFIDTFSQYDYVVAPSASCTHHVQHHYNAMTRTAAVDKVRASVYDICEFLHDILKVEELDVSFPYKVGIHQSCHGLRGSRLAKSSELIAPEYSKWRSLLELVRDIQFVSLDRPDECCGFGGTFSVDEEAVSVKMGQDRIADHEKNGADFIVSGDMSCLMHMEGIIRREKRSPSVKHIVEILAGQDS